MDVSQKKGFTFVELIVVVVILGVLGAIGLVSYSSYLGGARDSNRITQLSDIKSGLSVYGVSRLLPKPEDSVNVIANANVVAYQGYAGEKTLNLIGYNDGGTDPLDKTYFTYYLTKNKKDFQLMGFLEEENAVAFSPIAQTYANTDYSERYPTVIGKKLGVLVENITNTPVQEIESIVTVGDIDIATTGSTYKAYYNDSTVITGTGGTLAQTISNGSCKRILETGNSIGSGIYKISPTGVGTTQVYCDMETEGGGWTILVNNDNSDDETLTGDCKPRLSAYAPHVCGSVDETSDFVVNASGIQFNDFVFAAYETRFSNIKTYQFMKWNTAQEIPTTETYELPQNDSFDNILEDFSSLTVLRCTSYDPRYVTLHNGAGVFEPHTTIQTSVSGTPREMSFIDDGPNSGTKSTYGLDDYQDGDGCSDGWDPKSYRGYSSYMMVR